MPLSTREEFDPSSESIHGLLSGGSRQREEPEEEDEPMSDPYTRPSRHSTARRGSQQRKVPPPGSSQRREQPGERWSEDHRSSTGSPGSRINLPPEEVGLSAEEEQGLYFEAEGHVQKEAAALWSLKINLKVIILLTKLLKTLGSCMKLVSFAQDYLMEVWHRTPAVNILSTYVNGVIFSLIKGYFFDAKVFEDLNGRSFLGQDTFVVFSQGPGKLEDGSHITRRWVNSMK